MDVTPLKQTELELRSLKLALQRHVPRCLCAPNWAMHAALHACFRSIVTAKLSAVVMSP